MFNINRKIHWLVAAYAKMPKLVKLRLSTAPLCLHKGRPTHRHRGRQDTLLTAETCRNMALLWLIRFS